MKGSTGRISTIFRNYGVCTVISTAKTIRKRVRSIQSNIKHEDGGVCMMPCSCGKIYVGETRSNLNYAEHTRADKNENVKKSAVVIKLLTKHVVILIKHVVRVDCY